MLMRKIVVGMVLLFCIVAVPARATTYYVATDGNDNANGLSLETPFKTIQKAANIVNPGDTVLVREGTYYENGRLDINRNGTEGNWITFRPYNDEEVFIVPSKIYDANSWTLDANGVYTRVFDNFEPNGGGLIRKDGYGITSVNTYEELLDPNIHPYGIAMLELFGMDPNNFDLYYFNPDTHEISVKLAYGSPNDVYVVTNWNRVEAGTVHKVGGTYVPDDAFVEISGFTIQYTFEGIKSYGSYTKIINNTVKNNHKSSIFVPYGENTLIANNNISYTGTPLQYLTGQNRLIYNTLDHSIYVKNVEGAIIRNNTMEKCIGGNAMKVSGNAPIPTNCEVYNNYIDGGFFSDGINNKVRDNIILDEFAFRPALFIFATWGYEFRNNTVVAKSPATLGSVTYGGLWNFSFKNNIVYSEGDNSLRLEDVNFATADINNNAYYGGDNFTVGPNRFSDFNSYQTYMVSNYSLEGQSFYADPCFIDADGNDFHIDIHSPCVNAGDPNGNYDDQNDIDGDARVIGSYVDIGADEVNVPVSDAHQWGLDEKSGPTANDSVGTSNGTFNGNDPCWTDGLIGGAVDFDGVSDYFSVPSLDTAYSDGNVFTVTGWFKTDQSVGTQAQTIVGAWWQDGVWHDGWQVLVENNTVVARFAYDDMTITDIGTQDVNAGEWCQFAMVHNGTSIALYVNGQPAETGTANFSPYSTKFRIGDGGYEYPSLKSGPFHGIIDDLMIFNRVLSAEEILQLFQEVAE